MTLAAILILLQLADGYTTYIGIERGHRELNPFLNFLRKSLRDYWWIVVTKAVGIALAIYLASDGSWLAVSFLVALIAFYSWVVYRNVRALA